LSVSSVKSPNIISGKTAFFEPLIGKSPISLLPPFMTILSIILIPYRYLQNLLLVADSFPDRDEERGFTFFLACLRPSFDAAN
jgi:hypothetical protein